MIDKLKEKAAKGILWKFIDQGGTQAIQFVSGIYIARILTPEDYGLVGMMAIFLAISQVFVDSGFKATLIQKGTKVTQDDYNVVFYFNFIISVIFFLIIFFCASPLANFYNEPKLVTVAKVLGINLMLVALGAVHQVTLEKRLNFRTITKIRLVSVVLSASTGIVLAIKGFGVWSLVAMTLIESFFRTLLLWIINNWRPSLTFNIEIFNTLFAKGSKILLNGILGQINQNIYSLIIGRYFATTDVGFYSQGRKLQQRVGDFISYSFQGVMFPVLSLIKDNPERLKNSVRKNVTISTLVAYPAIVGLIVIAKPFVLLFLTEKWLPSVYYLQMLSVAGILFTTNLAIRSYLLPLGKFNFLVIYGAISNGVLLGFILVSLIFNAGLRWIIAIKVIHEFLSLIVIAIFSKQFINYRFTEIVKDLIPAFLYSTIMGAIVYTISYVGKVSFLILAIQIIAGTVIYLGLNYIFNKKLFDELKVLFSPKTIA